MFFDIRMHEKYTEQTLQFSAELKVEIPTELPSDYLLQSARKLSAIATDGDVLCRKLTFSLDMPDSVKEKIKAHTPDNENIEEYTVLLGEESVIYAKSLRGFIYGLSTIFQLADHGELFPSLIYDYPECPIRGYRVYMPGEENIALFKNMIDLLVYYKYNSIILEIGGAMEYKRHPEINEKWVEACNSVRFESGKAKKIQEQTYPWKKNSIHCDNGDGGYLSQEQCRDIADYCRARGLEVIPECPTMSHCDYMLLPHPELAERDNDSWPDTYCPNHPEVYNLVFDVLDEVISVFEPSFINIGHDELYSVALCPRCQNENPVDLYLKDIARIKEYLDNRGIRTMMWAEKLVKAVDKRKGHRFGGWYDPIVYPDGTVFQVPDFYQCADLMPKGIIYLHWYYGFGKEHDHVFHDRGYEMVFANFSVFSCEAFRERINNGCRGGIVSNWGSNEDEYMQRNCQYFALISTAYALWSKNYDSDRSAYLTDLVLKENYRRHYKGKKNLIKVTHTSDCVMGYKCFYDGVFIEDDVYVLGDYILTYTDGTSVSFAVKYGTNVLSSKLSSSTDNSQPDIFGSFGVREVSGRALPVVICNKVFYECGFENPYPEKTPQSFVYQPREGKENITVTLEKVAFE